MRILVDENIPLVDEFFGGLGEVIKRPGRTMVSDEAKTAGALLVRSVTKVNAGLLNGGATSFVGTCTIGVDHLDLNYFQEAGITYSSAPGCNANSVVEYVYAALCHLDVNWTGKRFGIIGCGNVGGLLHRRLKLQGIDCYCYDPLREDLDDEDAASLEEVLSCDIISMHTPLTTTGDHPSFHLIGMHELQQIRSGAVLINAGRGPVINNSALTEFLKQRNDVRVVLDVWEPEPQISLELLDLIDLGSPHIAGYSYDGKLKGTEMIYQALCKHLNKPADIHLGQLVPPLQNNQLKIDESLSVWAQVKQLIAQVYDIEFDDRNLRALANESKNHDDVKGHFGKGFDGLRKHYPVRREFHNYQVALRDSESESANWLRVLGFQVVPA